MVKCYFYIFVKRFLYSDLCNYRSSNAPASDFSKHQYVSREINANTKSSVLNSYLLHRWSEKRSAEGSKYAHWIGLYLSFHLSWVLGPFVHGRLQNLKTSEDIFGHDIAL